MDSTKSKTIFTNNSILKTLQELRTQAGKHYFRNTLLLETLLRSIYKTHFYKERYLGKKTHCLQTKEFKPKSSLLQHLTNLQIPSQEKTAQELLKVFKKNFQKLNSFENLNENHLKTYALCNWKG